MKYKLETGIISLAFIVPPIILYFIPVTITSLSWLLGFIPSLAIAIYLTTNKVPVYALGLTLNFSSVIKIIPGTLFIAAWQLFFLALVPWFYGKPRSLYLKIDYDWYFYITVFQEIVWRGFAFLLLENISECLTAAASPHCRQKLIIIISALLFAFMHVYFKSILVIAGSFGLGIHWGQNYGKYRSIMGIAISHYFLGLIFIMLNIWDICNR